ncbi:SGT1 and CS domain protein [Aspergillus campestris IBT 28561]|uniref:SGT1 and CS domain protein n=1 Tax=Aspergillus campestris (strain IBT 28561) TaxID=1392248 RepID=A0A2I1D279_ASPC2|nr:SGT1 and CS domain protein [Aspergillus campestris IBT 28561]PKY03948.1 SGT1 and CS domain protein [Aspergillus campestris IBT 28561]
MNSASQGEAALASSDFPSAIRCFTQALVEHPRSPTYYIKRSTAFSRLRPADGGPNHAAALRDAEVALTLAQERGRRELIMSAQMRRGVSLYQAGKYGDADYLFGWIQQKIAPGGEAAKNGAGKEGKIQDAMAANKGSSSASSTKYEQELPIWKLKTAGSLRKLAEDDPSRAVTVSEYPAGVRVPSEKELKGELEALKSGKVDGVQAQAGSAGEAKGGESAAVNAASASTGAGGQAAHGAQTSTAAPSADKVRHEWYQTNDTVVVTIYVKGIPKDSVDVDIKEDSITLQFPLPSGSEYDFTLDPLFAPIDTATSKLSVMSTKLEMVLRKQTPGQKWSTLEASSTNVKISDRAAASGAAPASTPGPAYPSSSRHGAKDWDKLASTLTAKKPSKEKGKEQGTKTDDAGDESDGAESVDSDLGGDAVDGFFKKLYAGADPDTRRAMVKSYVESQGTSLSTNWSEVGQGKVKAHPPSD